MEEKQNNKKKLQIRNSTAEFLVFQLQDKEDGVEVIYKDETLWVSQKAMAFLFDVDRSVITKHLKSIFDSKELDKDSVCAIFAHTAEDGKIYQTQHYNLDAVISVGYRVNSIRATQFRQWCTAVLRQFAIRGYVIDRFLSLDDRELLGDNGDVSAEEAKTYAECEFEKYRIIQDRLFESDFDREIKGLFDKE